MKRAGWMRWMLAVGMACHAITAAAQVSVAELLHPLFQDHAVVQRERPVAVWGNAAPGTLVSVSFARQTITARADAAGHWQATLRALGAGGPYQMVVRAGPLTRVVRDVLVGDVWLCSGQSNMELPVWRALDADSEIASATQPLIRLFSVPKAAAVTAQAGFAEPVAWHAAAPATVRGFSAACFFFARELQKTVHVPMGLIQAAWGGSRIEAWTSAGALRSQHGMQPALDVLALYARDPAAASARWGQHWQQWWTAHGSTGNGDAPWQSGRGEAGWHTAPAELGAWERWGVPALASYNGMVWYRTHFTLSTAQALQGARLVLGPVDETDLTWVNGVAIGSQYGPGEARCHAVPAGLLRPGRNPVVINVLDTYGDGGLAGPTAAHALLLDDGTRIVLDAAWQYRVAAGAPAPPLAPWHAATGLSTLFNGMIAPLGNYGLRGMLWYQGESNTGDGAAYATRLRSLREDWRSRFGPQVPLLVVQLAGYGQPVEAPGESAWAQVREAQRRVAAEDPHTGLALAIDIGDAYDIHPPNKQELGRRLSRAARHVVYADRTVAASGPSARNAIRTADEVRITFDDVTGALVTTGASGPIGFELCDADAQHCTYAGAVLQGRDVVLRGTAAMAAARVRYCWADGPVCTLRDRSGAPAGPFELSLANAEVP